jgi:hypothetical protein
MREPVRHLMAQGEPAPRSSLLPENGIRRHKPPKPVFFWALNVTFPERELSISTRYPPLPGSGIS